jgi:hypothetical protein
MVYYCSKLTYIVFELPMNYKKSPLSFDNIVTFLKNKDHNL